MPRIQSKDRRLALEDLTRIVASLELESDRSAAILSGSLIESIMLAFLNSHLKDTQITRSFTWSLSEQWLHSLGLIRDEIKSESKKIRDIRNQFSHMPRILEFDDITISSQCRSLFAKNMQAIEKEAISVGATKGDLGSHLKNDLLIIDSSKEKKVIGRFTLSTDLTPRSFYLNSAKFIMFYLLAQHIKQPNFFQHYGIEIKPD